MEIRSTLRRLTWPEKRLKEKEKGGRGGMKEENETNKREREKPGFTGCQTFPYHARNQEKLGVFARFAYFFFFLFLFHNDASRKQTATTAPFQLVNRLFFHDGGAEKPSNDHVKTQTILSCARAPRRIMRIISRENRGNSLISLRERIGGWCNWKR